MGNFLQVEDQKSLILKDFRHEQDLLNLTEQL